MHFPFKKFWYLIDQNYTVVKSETWKYMMASTEILLAIWYVIIHLSYYMIAQIEHTFLYSLACAASSYWYEGNQ